MSEIWKALEDLGVAHKLDPYKIYTWEDVKKYRSKT